VSQVGYHLTLSNGRGPVDAYMDLDENKAIGWRLWVQNDSPLGIVVLGTSGYRGRYTDRPDHYAGAFSTTFPVGTSYDELSLAFDLKWTWKGLLLQSEAVIHDTHYTDEGRPVSGSRWTPDNREWGTYALAGYRLPWFGIMPFMGFEYNYLGNVGSPKAADVLGGLNIRPIDRLVLKLVALHLWLPDEESRKPETQFMAQCAWSF
jgi:hypothetical protein